MATTSLGRFVADSSPTYDELLIERLVPSRFSMVDDLFYYAYRSYMGLNSLGVEDYHVINKDIDTYISDGNAPPYVRSFAKLS